MIERRSAVDVLRTYHYVNGFIPSILFTVLCIALLLWARRSLWGLAVLALPGTFAHELAHLLVGTLLRAEPVGISLWPKRSGGAWTLGNVSFRRAGVFNSAFIALAPILLLPIGCLIFVHATVHAWSTGHWGWWTLSGYLSATLLYGSMPSFTDIKLGAISFVFYLIAFALCWWGLSAMYTGWIFK